MSNNDLHLSLEVPRIGAFLRQIAPVTTGHVKDHLELQKKEGGRLGELLIERGLISSQDVLEALRRQAHWAAQMRGADLNNHSFPLDTFFSLVLPCYNEGDVIAGNLDAALVILPEFVTEFEIIVVDDGSHDNTGSIVESYAQSDSRIRLVQHATNQGYGAAVTSGFRAARGELVCLTDGDGQFSLVDLAQLLVGSREADAVFGYRFQRADIAIRSFNARCWNWLMRALLGIKIRDLDCAFKLLPRWVVDEIELSANGACISGEIVTQCFHGGLRICEVPVNHYPRYHGDATGANMNVIGKAFRELPSLLKYRKAPQLRQAQDRETHETLIATEPEVTHTTA